MTMGDFQSSYYRSCIAWSVNGELFAPQTRTSDVCNYHLPIMCGPINSFRDELRATLRSLHSRMGHTAVMCSGGADSEMIAREFKYLGLSFELHFIKFTDGSNQADYLQAVLLSEHLNQRLHVHQHNIEAFVTSKNHIQLGLEYGTSDLSLLTVYHYARNLGLPIILGPEVLLQKHQRPGPASAFDEWYVILGEHSSSAERFMKRHRTPLLGELHFSGAALLMSALRLPQIARLVSGVETGRISLSYLKNPILEAALGYSFIAKKKRHGYEPIYPRFRQAVNEIKNALPYLPFELRIPYHEIMLKVPNE